MTYTAIPSIKGQITIPSAIRNKYEISNETPMLVEDKGNGVITIRVMRLVEHGAIEYYEDDKKAGITFKKGIDPQAVINAIKKIDG